MVTRWFLHGLFAIVVIGVLALAGLWWWSLQVPSLAMAEQEERSLTLDNGVELNLVSDPDAPSAEMTWYWETGTLSDPSSYPGLHQLFSRVVMYGETPSGYRHLDTRARRDPQGAVDTHTDLTHTRVTYTLSPAALADEVSYFARLIQTPALPLEAVAYEREQLTEQNAAYSFLSPGEATALSNILVDRLSEEADLFRDMDTWEGMSNDGIARRLAQYADERLTGDLMSVTITAPDSLDDLEALASSAFGQQRAGSAQPSADTAWGELQDHLSDALYEPVSADTVAAGQVQQVPGWRLLFPWRLTADQRADAKQLVRWFNANYENAPPRQLREAGLIETMSARVNDEFLVVDIEPSTEGEDNPEQVYATLAAFLARIQNHDDAPTQIARVAGQDRVAPELTIRGLDFDPTLFIMLDNQAPSDATASTISQPDMTQALALDLPQSAPERTRTVADVDANAYELLGWQPQLMMDTPGVTLWHYEDNAFGTYLASAHLRVDLPIGHDRAYQERWQRWAEQQGPGWNDQVIWTDHMAQSAAQGLRVTVDKHGITWHYTDHWSEVEPWLYTMVDALEDQEINLPSSSPERSEPHRLIRERAGLVEPPQPDGLGDRRNTVLLTGRVTVDEATGFGEWLDARRDESGLVVDDQVAPLPQPLEERHRFAELEFDDDRSLVTRVLQLPSNDLRQNELAELSLPWLQENLTMAVREEAFAGELDISLQAPVGHPGLEVRLSSATQDPARMGLYLRGFWSELARNVDGFSSRQFEATAQERADLLRDSARSLPALSQSHWEDISQGRQHFNGRILRARALEGTNIEGWQYFMRQWLFDGSARQLTVFEIGEDWLEDYEDARSIPANASAW